MAFAHRHTLVKHVKREHQGSSSSSSSPSGENSHAESANAPRKGKHSKDKRQGTAETSSGASHRRHESHTAAAPAAAAGTGTVGGRVPVEAERDADETVESPKERPVEHFTGQCDEISVDPSPVGCASPAAEP